MKNRLNRRDFLKVAGMLPLGLAIPRIFRTSHQRLEEEPKNIIVVVFDAWSACNIPLYGYERKTIPNITRLSKRAVVYHNHYAAGNFTTPGTASLLTGVLPWTHRALNHNGKTAEPFETRNLFGVFRNHYRIACTHNGLANTLLRQFEDELDELIPRERIFLDTYDAWISALFRNDDDISSVSWIRDVQINEGGYAYSLFLSHLYESLQEKKVESLKRLFPRGIPTAGRINPYLLENAVDMIISRLSDIPQPLLGYFHFMPPHQPYRTSGEFVNVFRGDGFRPVEKPIDSLGNMLARNLPQKRTEYDEFILYCDREFGRLYDYLESSGLLDHTWLVLTSDHGEMFERGIGGHGSKVLYQPVVRIPLMIFEPGRSVGMDVYDYTSAIDVLPTLAHLVGEEMPEWAEGLILPPYASAIPNSSRNLYVVQAIDNYQYAPLTQASTVLLRENYKLHYYFGYPEVPEEGRLRLYDITSDPEEMVDLYDSRKGIASELLNELRTKLREADSPYR